MPASRPVNGDEAQLLERAGQAGATPRPELLDPGVELGAADQDLALHPAEDGDGDAGFQGLGQSSDRNVRAEVSRNTSEMPGARTDLGHHAVTRLTRWDTLLASRSSFTRATTPTLRARTAASMASSA